MDDHALLKEYAENASEEAFRTLVERHIHHVYSAAFREMGDPHEAEEVTQVTFIILSRKAKTLSQQVILSGWLFQTMRFAAKNARRQEARRRQREEESARMNTENQEEAIWEQVSPLLNDALGSLSENDRNMVSLRFFEKKSHTEVAQALGINETSARKRLSRALDKLRIVLTRRGVAVPAVTLTSLLSVQSVQAAPPTLAFGVVGAVQRGTASVAATASAKGTLQMMFLAKLQKPLLVGIVGLLLAGGTAAVLVPEPNVVRPGFVRLSDGSVFGIEEHALGTQFQYKRSGGSIGVGKSDYTNLFIATSRTGTSRATRLSIGRLQIFDDQGAAYDGIFTGGTLVFGNEVHNLWRVPAFPRRRKQLGLRYFYGAPNGEWTKAAEFQIPNPAAAKSFPEWDPELLPTTKTDRELSVTLEAFETGIRVRGKDPGFSKLWQQLPATRAAFTFQQAGDMSTTWSVRGIEISDSTGNRWSPFPLSNETETEAEPRAISTWLGALWPQESAWRLQVELSRTNRFTKEEILEVPAIPVPKQSELLALFDAYEVNGGLLDLPFIAAPDVELPDPFKWSRKEGWYNLAVNLEPGEERKRLTLVKVQDDQGRPVEIDTEGARGTHQVYSLKPKQDARQLHFTFALHASRFVEFLASPVQLGRSKPAHRP